MQVSCIHMNPELTDDWLVLSINLPLAAAVPSLENLHRADFPSRSAILDESSPVQFHTVVEPSFTIRQCLAKNDGSALNLVPG
jgi:hypothetical protein